MIAVDTDVLLINTFYKKDKRFDTSQSLLKKLQKEEMALAIYNLLELCGILFVNKEYKLARRLFSRYQQSRRIKILYPGFWSAEREVFWINHDKSLLERTERGMRFGDAAILWVLEENNVSRLITWNKGHFENKTSITIQTPEEYLANE